VSAEDVVLPGPGGPLTLRLYRPAREAAAAVLLYLHGGGFVVGGLDSHDAICRVIAAETGTRVAALDYRLAPEHPFPAAVDDTRAALDWLAGRHAVLGVAGDSAGGTQAAVAALHARDRDIRLALQALVYPAVDQGGDHASRRRLAEGYLLSEDDIRWFGRQYFGDRPPVLTPDASPLRAPSHAGLAPALVVTCGFDPLCDEGGAYVATLAAAGVPVRHLRLEGGLHGCLNLARVLDCGRVALREMCRAWADVAA
jgi:acetyl esterase